jgi:phage terminase large subunit
MAKIITLPFKPHLYQQDIISRLKRFSVLVCHRRFGKSTLMVNLLLKWALSAKRENWRGAYIAPFRAQAKIIAWDYLLHYSDPVPQKKINISELTINFPNARLQLLGADYPDSLRGPYWDVVVFDEYAQIRPNCFSEIIRPALVDRKGWAIFIGTPKGHNHFYDLWNTSLKKNKDDPENVAIMYKASQTNILDPVELEKTRANMSPEEYEQEFECSFEAALVGSYYGTLVQDSLVNGRICNAPYDPILPVHTAWDLGVDDQTAIWFFQVHPAGEIRLIDYHEETGFGIDYYVGFLKDKKYIYGTHLAPHDIKARSFAAGGRSAFEVARSLGINFTVVPQSQIMDGIQAVRSIFPRCWFDQIKCERGIEVLKTYRKEYSQKLSTFKDRPLHDWASHGADAFRTMATGLSFIKSDIATSKMKMPSYDKYGEHGWML